MKTSDGQFSNGRPINEIVLPYDQIKAYDVDTEMSLELHSENEKQNVDNIAFFVLANDKDEFTSVTDYSVDDGVVKFKMPQIKEDKYYPQIMDNSGKVYSSANGVFIDVVYNPQSRVLELFPIIKQQVVDEIAPQIKQYVMDNADIFVGESGLVGAKGPKGDKGEPGIDVHSVKMNTQLFDKHDVLTGYYISSQTGDLVESSGFTASNYIPVIPNSKLTSLPTIGQSHFYDKDYNAISGVSSVDANPITVPSNARYFRTSTFGSGLDEKMIYLGDGSLDYQEYYNPELQNVLFSTAKVDFTSDGFPSITTKYDKDSNITYTFGALGINGIHHLKRIKTDYFDHNITSDYISPYRIRAVNNPIADNPVFVTGGNHGTDGGLGQPTADPVSIETFINNKKVTGGVHHTNEHIVVKVVNDVCGYNTVNRTTGVKRNILREHITYTFYQNVYTVSIEMVALEDLEFYGHRGLSIQKQNNTYRFTVQRDRTSTNNSAVDFNSTTEGSKAQRMVAETESGDMVAMFLDDRNGLGNFELNSNDPRWFTTSTKAYCNTIEQNSFERLDSGQSFILSGGYYYGKNMGDGVGLGKVFKIVLDGKVVYCMDDFYMRDAYILVEPEHENKKVIVLDNNNTISVGGFTTSRGLKYSARYTSTLTFTVE